MCYILFAMANYKMNILFEMVNRLGNKQLWIRKWELKHYSKTVGKATQAFCKNGQIIKVG